MQESRSLKRSVGVAVMVLGLLGQSAIAQPPPGEIEAVHIVRPGDTLRGITAKYLGSQKRWEELWRLNREVVDPDVLQPGQRLRVLLQPAVATPTARILSLSGQVHNRPAPIDWADARRQDLLVERDGLRTFKSSSSALQFPDGSSLVVSESSLVFMRRAGRSLLGVEERQVEIVQGQADLKSLDAGASKTDIEIVVGNALAKPRAAGKSGEVQARARIEESGGAAVMMYEGEGDVEAGGEKVVVERGMGTAVPVAGPPAPPEKLLEAPTPKQPEPASRWDFPDPVFSWEAVPGAAAYVVEVCSDSGCRNLVHRVAGLTSSEWRAQPLPVADLFWRVNAVSASGLDGYPSDSIDFTILSDRRDLEPPSAVGVLEGPAVTTDGKTYHAPNTSLSISVEDPRSGVEGWSLVVNGDPTEKAALAGGWEDGEKRVEVLARDVAGNQGTTEVARFHVDAEAPVIDRTPGDVELLVPFLGEEPVDSKWRKQRRRWIKRAHRRPGELRAPWVVVAWDSDLFDAGGSSFRHPEPRRRRRSSFQSLMNTGSHPRIAILAPTLELSNGEVLGDRLLVFGAGDAKSGTWRLTLSTVMVAADDGRRRPFLRIEAVDRLLNRRVDRLGFAE